MIKTVIFDLGQVIVPFDLERGFQALGKLYSLPPEQVGAKIASTDLMERFEKGFVASKDFHRALSALLGINTDYKHFCAAWNSIFLPETLIPEGLVAALRKRHRLLLLSNTNAIHFEMIRHNYPVLRLFDSYILSFEVGAMKPSPEIYRVAISSAGCLPGEIFYTDDRPDFVEAARREGIQAVQFQSLPQLEVALRAHGVDW